MLCEEKWLLQGMPMSKHQGVLDSLPGSFPHALAGNGWCFYNFIPAFLVALAAAPISWMTPGP